MINAHRLLHTFAPLAAWTSLVLYVLCLAAPAYLLHRAPGQDEPMPGLYALALGWLLLGTTPAWLANPLYFVGLIFYFKARPGGALVCSILALFLSLSFTLATELPQVAGAAMPFTIRIGYVLWVVSIGLLLVASLGPADAVASSPPSAPTSDA